MPGPKGGVLIVLVQKKSLNKTERHFDKKIRAEVENDVLIGPRKTRIVFPRRGK